MIVGVGTTGMDSEVIEGAVFGDDGSAGAVVGEAGCEEAVHVVNTGIKVMRTSLADDG